MNSFGSVIVHLLLRTLDPAERDVVEGDLRELSLPRNRVIRELVGLHIRRQIAAWVDWRPWAAVVLVALPLGMMLSLVSRHWANGTAIYAWFYVDNWTPAYLASAGARSDLLHATTEFFARCVALVLWAWTIGFAVASVSRRTVWLTYALFGLVLCAGTVGSTTVGIQNPANAAVFSQPFYRVGIPVVFRILFVLLPALHGVRKAAFAQTVRWVHAAALAVTVTLVTAAVARGTPNALTFGWWSSSGHAPMIPAVFRLKGSWQLRLLPFAMALPSAYVFSTATWRSWRQRTQLS